jgi:hypothetical protein
VTVLQFPPIRSTLGGALAAALFIADGQTQMRFCEFPPNFCFVIQGRRGAQAAAGTKRGLLILIVAIFEHKLCFAIVAFICVPDAC